LITPKNVVVWIEIITHTNGKWKIENGKFIVSKKKIENKKEKD